MKYLILSVVCTLMLFVTVQRRTHEQNPPQLPLMAIGSDASFAQPVKLDLSMSPRVREIDPSNETRFAIQVRCLHYTRTQNTDALFDKIFADSTAAGSPSENEDQLGFKSRILKTKSVGPAISKLLNSDQCHLGQEQTRIVRDGQPVAFAKLDRVDLSDDDSFQQCAWSSSDEKRDGDCHLAAVEAFDWNESSSIVMTTTIQAENTIRLQATARNSRGIPIGLDSVQSIQPGQMIAVWSNPDVRDTSSKSIVPVMGNLPFVGHRFQKTTTTKTAVETVYLITTELIPARVSNQ